TIPGEYVLDAEGKEVSWPLPVNKNPGQADPVFLDYTGMIHGEGWVFYEEEISLRAIFDGGKNAAGASEPAAVEFEGKYDGIGAPTDATAQVGPANVDLLTGQYTITRTDVAIEVPGTE